MAEQEKIATVGLRAAGVAHEINNPLDGLQNCVRRIVKDPGNTAQIERYARLMTASLSHIETVVKQLLSLSHKREGTVRELSINEVLADAVSLARAGQSEKDIEVDWQLSHQTPRVMADAQAMTQVFLNLVLNALAATPEGGKLTLTTRRRPSRKARGMKSPSILRMLDN